MQKLHERIPDTLAELEVPIDSLRPYGRNPRRGDLAAIRESLDAHGQYRPIVARKGTGEVLAGNHTLAAALELGWTSIAATFVDVDDDQAARIVLVDNRTSDLGGYDDGALTSLLRSLPDLAGTAWAQADLDKLLDEQLGDGADRDTEPGPVPATPKTRRGDIWSLGLHQLICGDSTSPSTVTRLFQGGEADERAEMVWSDPPYGVDYEDSAGRKMAGDKRGHDAHYDLLKAALENAAMVTSPGGAIYLMAGSAIAGQQALIDAGWGHHQTLIWVKDQWVLSRQDYHWQHEQILYGWKPGAAHRFHGGLNQATVVDDDDLAGVDRKELLAIIRDLRNEIGTTVVREDRPTHADLHPTMKPVGLVARQIANSSRRYEIVYEPFAGSGTTLIAAENLARVCYAVELEPGYCDVIVDRWERHTGQEATRDASARAA
jgi:DNA modification methylase